MTHRLVESLGTTEALADVFSDESLLGSMLAFEVALARVEARLGVIPATAAAAIADAADPAVFDAGAIATAARRSGTIAIPFVDRLRARVREIDDAAATFVHWGATSQDVTDTFLVLALSRARPVLAADHERLALALRDLSNRHARTVMLARTLLQPAAPTTFGLKAAGWLAALAASWAHLSSAFDEALALQFGGAAGTLAALGDDGPAVAAELARELGLPDRGTPWHADRTRVAAVLAASAIYTGALGKLARDVSLLMQPEIGEVAEPGGSSSTMPHKRNPAGCAIVLAQAARVPGLVSSYVAALPQEHERGLGGWHAETATIVTVVQATGAAVAAAADMVEALDIDTARMRANVVATNGVVFAERAVIRLAPALGRERASQIVAAAIATARSGRGSFGAALAANADVQREVPAAELETFDDPEAYLGAAEVFRRRLLGTD